jgi:hypothetical protein
MEKWLGKEHRAKCGFNAKVTRGHRNPESDRERVRALFCELLMKKLPFKAEAAREFTHRFHATTLLCSSDARN